jgi:hypothetical protein
MTKRTARRDPDAIAADFVAAAVPFVPNGHDTHRLLVSLTCPCLWSVWRCADLPELIGRRAPGAVCLPGELALFDAARELVAALISRLEMVQRCWLMQRLEPGRVAEIPGEPAYLQLALDLAGASWGIRCTIELSATRSATIAALGGTVERAQLEAAAA